MVNQLPKTESKMKAAKKFLEERGYEPEEIMFIGEGKAVNVAELLTDFHASEELKRKMPKFEEVWEIVNEMEDEENRNNKARMLFKWLKNQLTK